MKGSRRRACLLVLLAVAASLLVPAGSVAAAPREQVLQGRVVDSAGRPVVGATVVVHDGQGALAAVVDVLICVFSLGLADEACAVHAVSARTDRTGQYRVALPAGSPVARPGTRQVGVTGPAAPRVATFAGSFALTARTRALAPLVLWTTTASYARRDGRMTVQRRLPPGATTARLALRSADLRSLEVAWPLVFDRAGRADVDERVFEHGVRSLEGTATGRWAGRPARWASAASAVPQVGRPGTRGTACYGYRAGDELVALPGCAFTDGRLATPLGLFLAADLERRLALCQDDSECSSPNTVVLDLGEVRRPDAVVWRGCRGCELELSLEGRVWLPWRGEHREGSDFAAVTGDLQPARYVRVRGSVFLLWHLQEISVWSSPLLTGAAARPQPSPASRAAPGSAPTEAQPPGVPLLDLPPLPLG